MWCRSCTLPADNPHVFLEHDGSGPGVRLCEWLYPLTKSQNESLHRFYVVGPRLIDGRGVFVVFRSFCPSFYSILCCCRRASGPSSNFFLIFRDFCSCELSFLELHTLLMLRCELSSWNFTRSWCYVVNFLPRTSHALDATLWTFFLELHTLLGGGLGGFWGG